MPYRAGRRLRTQLTTRTPQLSAPDGLEPDAPLPRGRHGLAPEVVERHQRERVVSAVVTLIAERGHTGLTVERIVNAAKISRSTFYRYFANRHEAVLAAHELVFERFLVMLTRACDSAEEWPDRVNAGIGASLEFAVAEPDQARMLVAEFLSPDVALAQRAGRSHDRLAALLAEGRRYQPQAVVLPASLERALIGGIATVVARGLIGGERQRLPDLQAQLVEFTLLPYLGTADAARAVSRAT